MNFIYIFFQKKKKKKFIDEEYEVLNKKIEEEKFLL
jgi:hypothetical protein